MPIFTHVMLGASDIEESRKFYDAALAPLGYKRLFDAGDRSGYGAQAAEFMITKPIDGKPASAANGFTLGLVAPNRKAVDEFHKQGLANGGKCEGPPGPRPVAPNFYSAYLRDPVGNKITAICMSAE